MFVCFRCMYFALYRLCTCIYSSEYCRFCTDDGVARPVFVGADVGGGGGVGVALCFTEQMGKHGVDDL